MSCSIFRHALVVGVALAASACLAQTSTPIIPRSGLLLARPGRSGRDSLPRDSVQKLIVEGRWIAPSAGDTVTLPDGSARAWKAVEADRDGRFADRALPGGYLYVAVPSPEARTMLLEASGHSMVYVNGEPRAGDPYRLGFVRLPVRLRQGVNELLFMCSRPELNVRLAAVEQPYLISAGDATLPDLVPDDRETQHGAVVIINASDRALTGAMLEASLSKGKPERTSVAAIPPMSLRKTPLKLPRARKGPLGNATLLVRLKVGAKTVSQADLKVGIRAPEAARKCTFVSEIDGSVQYYAVVPPRPDATPPAMVFPEPASGWRSRDLRTNAVAMLGTAYQVLDESDRYERELRAQARPPGLVLTCHGAGVEAIGQASSYSPKRGLWIVAPTNRRPFGFDWEEWGRMDAMEVLNIAQARYRTDPSRTYLTGHSMGGHGTWHLGVTFPDRFAAVGPSAGWISFQSYAGVARHNGASAAEGILKRATSPSDTLRLATNLKPLGVYILHGDADDNVPVTEARAMFAHLKGFHRDAELHEQPGAGHWWGAPSDPGTGCVDWPAMFDLFQRRSIQRSDETRHVEFTTMNPGVSARMRWLTILHQQRPLAPSSASIRCDPVGRRFVGTTDNVAALSLDTVPFGPGPSVTVDLDGTRLEVPLVEFARQITLRRGAEGWKVGLAPADTDKKPGRAGPFKEAFSHRFILVYGTGGTPEENAWAFARARYDAESFWYRGNGAPEVLADSDFSLARYRDRSVIVYGHREMNRAWDALLAGAPVQVSRGKVSVGDRELTGTDLACLFCYPRPDSSTAYVAAVAGSGPAGMRLTDRAPYFVSGTGFPDLMVWTPRTLAEDPDGVRAAGFFGNDWSVTGGDVAFAP